MRVITIINTDNSLSSISVSLFGVAFYANHHELDGCTFAATLVLLSSGGFLG